VNGQKVSKILFKLLNGLLQCYIIFFLINNKKKS